LKTRFLITFLAILLCLAAVCAVAARQKQLARLRAEERDTLSDLSQISAPPAAPSESSSPHEAPAASTELLRLRSEVAQLTQRRQALAGVAAENRALKSQLASGATNAPSGVELPPGFLRKSQAQLVGYASPQDTLQSLLWAVQNRDLTNLLQALTPEAAHWLTARKSAHTAQELFDEIDTFVGMAVVATNQQPGGGLELEVETIPGRPPVPIGFQQINGEWKIQGPSF